MILEHSHPLYQETIADAERKLAEELEAFLIGHRITGVNSMGWVYELTVTEAEVFGLTLTAELEVPYENVKAITERRSSVVRAVVNKLRWGK